MNFIRFELPAALFAVPVIILLICLFKFLNRRFEKEKGVLEEFESWIIPNRKKLKETIRGVCGAMWLMAAVIGFSGAQFFMAASSSPLHNIGEIIILDASRSMTSEEDVFGAGGRFGAAKREIIEELAPLSKNKIRPRLGLVIFSGSSRRSFMLYDNYDVLVKQVSGASIFSPNDQGTNYEAALSDALELCENAKDLIYCSAVLVTDGDREAETPGLFTGVLPKFAEKKVRLDVIGVGKKESPLPSLGELGSPMEFRQTERGTELVPILTKYDEKFLKEIASAGGGDFYRFDEKGFLRKHLSQIRNAVESEAREITKRWTDVSEYFYIAAVILLSIYLAFDIPFKKIKIKFLR